MGGLRVGEAEVGEGEEFEEMRDHEEFTHVAYSDEAYYSKGEYRSISLLTLNVETAEQIRIELVDILKELDVSEFKWKKVRGAKYYQCAKKILNLVTSFALKNKIRVDTIIYSGTKHVSKGVNIFQLMYYQLFKNVLIKRWQANISWKLFPDKQSNINWDKIKEFLDLASFDAGILTRGGKRLLQLVKRFNIVKIEEVDSKKEALSQIPDLFAGLAAFSRLSYSKYLKRYGTLKRYGILSEQEENEQEMRLTGRERYRFKLLEYFNECCKKHKFGVSLKSSEGLWTPNPKNPINFWTIKEQSSNEKTKQVPLSHF